MVLATLLVVTFTLLGVLVVTYLHLPFWMQRFIAAILPWLQAAALHVGYASWLGGVTGHLVGAFISAPWFLLLVFWLRPRTSRLTFERSSGSRSLRSRRWRSMRNADLRLGF